MSTKLLRYTIGTLLLLEILIRIALSFQNNISFLKMNDIIYHFYPELDLIEDFNKDENKANLLILGGSVVCADTVKQKLNDKIITSNFCNLAHYLNADSFNVITLARPGQNSLDSKIKYQLIPKDVIDAVFVYHGINDTRTNNTSSDTFDKKYRHIQFYDQLDIFLRHPEIRIIAIPYFVDLLSNRIKNKTYIPKEFFYGLLNGEPEEFLDHGNEIKSIAVFENNIEQIVELSRQKKETLLLSTYAFHHVENYSYDKFKNQQLDYDEQVFPTELYGIPKNVIKGIEAHNSVIKQWSNSGQDVKVIDLNGAIPKSGSYFNDVCHLNQNGCEIMAAKISNALRPID